MKTRTFPGRVTIGRTVPTAGEERVRIRVTGAEWDRPTDIEMAYDEFARALLGEAGVHCSVRTEADDAW